MKNKQKGNQDDEEDMEILVLALNAFFLELKKSGKSGKTIIRIIPGGKGKDGKRKNMIKPMVIFILVLFAAGCASTQMHADVQSHCDRYRSLADQGKMTTVEAEDLCSRYELTRQQQDLERRKAAAGSMTQGPRKCTSTEVYPGYTETNCK